jgi:WD40 repeat protein
MQTLKSKLPLVAILAIVSFGPLCAQMPFPIIQTGHNLNAIDISRSGLLLATADSNTIKIWDTTRTGLLRTFFVPGTFSGGLAFDASEELIAAGLTDGKVAIWHLDGDQSPTIVNIGNAETEVLSVRFIPLANRLVVGLARQAAYLCDLDGSHPITLSNSLNATHLVFAKTGNRIIGSVSSSGAAIRVWSARDGTEQEPLHETATGARSMSISPDESTVAIIENHVPNSPSSDVAKIWSLESKQKTSEIQQPGWNLEDITFVNQNEVAIGETRWYDVYAQTRRTILWDIAKKRVIRTVEGFGYLLSSANDTVVAANFGQQNAAIFPASSEGTISIIQGYSESVASAEFSPDRHLVAIAGKSKVSVLSLITGKVLLAFDPHLSGDPVLAFSHDNSHLAVADTEKDSSIIRVWNIRDKKLAQQLDLSDNSSVRESVTLNSLGFTADGNTLLLHGFVERPNNCPQPPCQLLKAVGLIWRYRISDRRLLRVSEPVDMLPCRISFKSPNRLLLVNGARLETRRLSTLRVTSAHQLSTTPWKSIISDNARIVAGVNDRGIFVWRADNAAQILHRDAHIEQIAVGPQGESIAAAYPDGSIHVVSLQNNGELVSENLAEHISSLAFSADGKMLVSVQGQTVTLWRITSHLSRLLTIALFKEGDWAVVDKDGRFDSNNLNSLRGVRWVFANKPRASLPAETFMRDYYEPDLLRRTLLSDTLPKVRPPPTGDLIAPTVVFQSIEREGGANYVRVCTSIFYDSKRFPSPERKLDAYELKLFRDGQLVADLPNDSAIENSQRITAEDDVASWKIKKRIYLGSSGLKTLCADHIQLPSRVGIESVIFSAYAFNAERVKSETATSIFPLNLLNVPTLSTRNAFVVSVGVNAYEGKYTRDLKYAAGDAKLFSLVMKRLLEGQGYRVFSNTLTSESVIRRGIRRLTSTTATKNQLKEVLQHLENHSDLKTDFKGRDGETPPSTPDDLVVIYFSGHGYRDSSTDKFYLLPYDVGESNDPSEILNSSISSDELSEWLAGVDAHRIVLIVDACQSGAIVNSSFRAGPLQGRGMGQMAYDKRMQIIAASQSAELANENDLLKHGILTYALLVDGIQHERAFRSRSLTFTNWFEYANNRVPVLFRKSQQNREGRGLSRAPDFSRIVSSSKQVPQAFDWSEQEDNCVYCVAVQLRSLPSRLISIGTGHSVDSIQFGAGLNSLFILADDGLVYVATPADWHPRRIDTQIICRDPCRITSVRAVPGTATEQQLVLTTSTNGVFVTNESLSQVEAIPSAVGYGAPTRLVITGSGRQLVVIYQSGFSELIDLTSKGKSAMFSLPFRDLSDVSFSPDDTWIAATGPSSEVILTNFKRQLRLMPEGLERNAPKIALRIGIDWANSLDFNSNRHLLSCSSQDGTVKVFRWFVERQPFLLKTITFGEVVTQAAIDPTGDVIAVLTQSHIEIISATNGAKLAAFKYGVRQMKQVAWGDHLLVSHAGGTTVQLWDTSSERSVAKQNPNARY